MLLGRMTAKLNGAVHVGEECIVIAWRIALDGKKHIAGSALLNSRQELAGIARAVWFDVSPQAEPVS